jgi:hypothetical protein
MLSQGFLRRRQLEAPLTEPLILSTIHIAGFDLRVDAHAIFFAGYEVIPAGTGAAEKELRIVSRFAMTAAEARAFRDVLGGSLREGY